MSTPKSKIDLECKICYRVLAVLNSTPSSYAESEKSSAVATLQARKQQLVRDAIWDAAIDLFVEKGFDETTVDDIAHAAGVSRRSFFRYFSSKNDLMAHGVVSYGASLTDAIAECPTTFSLSEVFRETVRKVARKLPAGTRTRKIMGIAAKYPAAREAQLSRLAEVQEQVAEAFACRCGKTAAGDSTPHLLAALTLSTLNTAFRSWFHNGQNMPSTVDEVLVKLRHLVCDEEKATAVHRRESSKSTRKKTRQRI